MPGKIGVIGSGHIGREIAALALIAGYSVKLSDLEQEKLVEARNKIDESLHFLSARGPLKEDPSSIYARISTTTENDDLGDSDILIEAVKEKVEVKRQIFQHMSRVAEPSCVFLTSTSTIPLSDLETYTGRADRFACLHFAASPIAFKVAEFVKCSGTSAATAERVVEFTRSLGKECVVVERDVPGYIINRINDRVFCEALNLTVNGTEPGMIDAAMRYRLGFIQGAFEQMDSEGIDVIYGLNREMERHGFNTFAIAALHEKVEKGELGLKTRLGFYKYDEGARDAADQVMPSKSIYKVNVRKIFMTAINEAAFLAGSKIASVDDIDLAMVHGMGWPEGPLRMADRYGLSRIVKLLREAWAETKSSVYRPDSFLVEKVNSGKIGMRSGEGFFVWGAGEEPTGTMSLLRGDTYAIATLNRPDQLNALNSEEWRDLRVALESCLDDDSIRSVIITGVGRAFSAGDDIKMMKGWKGTDDARKWMSDFAEPLLSLMFDYPKPVISAVNGLAFGGGAELNMFSDLVVSSEKAVFSFSESLIGAMPPVASSLGLFLSGRGIAPYLLTGARMDAEAAKDIGLVDIIAPAGTELDIAVEFAIKISNAAPLSIRAIKSAINLSRSSCKTLFSSSKKDLLILASSKDFFEGQDAFVKKRKPIWSGE